MDYIRHSVKKFDVTTFSVEFNGSTMYIKCRLVLRNIDFPFEKKKHILNN